MKETDDNSRAMINMAIDHWRSRTGFATGGLKAALIDMDGTLYDSMRNHTAAWYRLMTEYGISCERDEFYLYEGCTGADTIRRLWPRCYADEPTDELIKELYALKSQYFNELPEVEVMPGAPDMVAELQREDITTVLVTGSGQGSVLGRLERDYPGAFPPERRVTARNVTHGKPSPEPYLIGMKLAGVAPDEAMVIENAPIGALAGVRSGAFTVTVMTGPIPVSEFEAVGADLIVSSMEEFASVLPALISGLKEK